MSHVSLRRFGRRQWRDDNTLLSTVMPPTRQHPYWDPHARGAIFGLTRDTGIGEIVIAGLEAVCFQTRDLIEAMKKDGVSNLHTLRVDGG